MISSPPRILPPLPPFLRRPVLAVALTTLAVMGVPALLGAATATPDPTACFPDTAALYLQVSDTGKLRQLWDCPAVRPFLDSGNHRALVKKAGAGNDSSRSPGADGSGTPPDEDQGSGNDDQALPGLLRPPQPASRPLAICPHPVDQARCTSFFPPLHVLLPLFGKTS